MLSTLGGAMGSARMIDPIIFKDSILAALLFVNMIYLGRKIDGLSNAIWAGLHQQKRKRK